jgi:hypothetical protein
MKRRRSGCPGERKVPAAGGCDPSTDGFRV